MYNLFTDKEEIFECNIKLEGASIKNSKARIILETNDINLVFSGKIERNGICKVPIKRLKHVLDEGIVGKMKLEVIADDTYFEPWISDFIVKTSKNIKVEVKEQKDKESKKKIVVEVKKKEEYEYYVDTMVSFLKEINITTKNIIENKRIIKPLINKYFEKIGFNDKQKFLKEVIKKL